MGPRCRALLLSGLLRARADLRGFSLLSVSRHVTELLSAVSHVDKSHYPETLSACFVINPPAALAALLRLISPLISPATRRKARARCARQLPRVVPRRRCVARRVTAAAR